MFSRFRRERGERERGERAREGERCMIKGRPIAVHLLLWICISHQKKKERKKNCSLPYYSTVNSLVIVNDVIQHIIQGFMNIFLVHRLSKHYHCPHWVLLLRLSWKHRKPEQYIVKGRREDRASCTFWRRDRSNYNQVSKLLLKIIHMQT